ncbi:hypothetical protein B0H19DRAFT_1065874 [Mycena capillaripes]|nr:hypothetical protein B0H19DRAFT_1065874 [Mycena capillaripes]
MEVLSDVMVFRDCWTTKTTVREALWEGPEQRDMNTGGVDGWLSDKGLRETVDVTAVENGMKFLVLTWISFIAPSILVFHKGNVQHMCNSIGLPLSHIYHQASWETVQKWPQNGAFFGAAKSEDGTSHSYFLGPPAAGGISLKRTGWDIPQWFGEKSLQKGSYSVSYGSLRQSTSPRIILTKSPACLGSV